jgi:NAD(P)-dependent dehydrogenase (short-subunit alcohol dehydrogenase family)
MFLLENKKAVITGAGSGIGKAIAMLFARRGAEVHVIELSSESAASIVAEIEENGGSAFSHVCDVTNQQEVMKTFEAIGRHHILINNAGIAHIGRADTTAKGDFERVMDVNVIGVYNCLFCSIPIMKSGNGGVIVNMASIAAWSGIPDRFAYSAAKGAIAAMTLSVAKDYIKYNIRCNSISPARVHTPFVDNFLKKNYPGKETEMFEKLSQTQPIGRMATPEEVACLALYLCSDEASFITGTDYPFDGGFLKLNN